MAVEHRVPKHVAIIMDGNGRWAKSRRLPRIEGHREGKQVALRIIDVAIQKNIQALTLFAFSTENWNRPKDEVDFLFSLLSTALYKEADKLNEKNIKLRFVGSKERLSSSLTAIMTEVEGMTVNNSGLQLNVAIDFGGRWDIAQAAKQCAKKAVAGTLSIDSVDEAAIQNELSLASAPPVDMIIRTGDVCRISNFLLWEAAYAELFFLDKHWPEFNESYFLELLDEYASRERRYGKISEQLECAE